MSASDGNDRTLEHRQKASPLQGQVLRRSRRREAVLFLRDDCLWVADFIDGRGELTDAVTWIRFNCAAAKSTQAQRRMVLECAIPLSEDLVVRIEMLQEKQGFD